MTQLLHRALVQHGSHSCDDLWGIVAAQSLTPMLGQTYRSSTLLTLFVPTVPPPSREFFSSRLLPCQHDHSLTWGPLPVVAGACCPEGGPGLNVLSYESLSFGCVQLCVDAPPRSPWAPHARSPVIRGLGHVRDDTGTAAPWQCGSRDQPLSGEGRVEHRHQPTHLRSDPISGWG